MLTRVGRFDNGQEHERTPLTVMRRLDARNRRQ